MKINGNNNQPSVAPNNINTKGETKKPNTIFTKTWGNYTERYGDDGLLYEKFTLRSGGTMTNYYSYEYDDNGRTTKEIFDNSGGGPDGKSADGNPEQICTYEYNADGKIIKETLDNKGGGPNGTSADGNPDFITTYEYDENNVLIKKTVVSQGKTPDAPPEMVTTEEYSDGHKIKTSIDLRGGGPDGRAADGIPDWTRTYEPEENNT